MITPLSVIVRTRELVIMIDPDAFLVTVRVSALIRVGHVVNSLNFHRARGFKGALFPQFVTRTGGFTQAFVFKKVSW